MRQARRPSNGWFTAAAGFIVLGVLGILRNVVGVMGTPGWEQAFWQRFVSPSFTISGTVVPEALGHLLVWGPFVALAIAVPLLVVAAVRQPAVRERQRAWEASRLGPTG